VVAGASRGGEAALLIGATFPRLVHGAIGLVPNYQTWGGSWTFRGRPIPHDHLIPVERINGPVLVAGAGEDALWSSSVYTDQIELRLADHHFRFPHQRLDFPHAGHLVGTAIPYVPEVDSAYFGGRPRATAAGQVKVWKHILAFMRELH
jgi:pimeloyl-ACP methyl ester carboxylesterase